MNRTSRHPQGDGPRGRGSPARRLLDSQRCLDIARRAASRLKRKFPWVPTDDLYSYTLFGLVRAANNYDPDRHVPFDIYAARKAMYVAIDEMRKDRVLRRSRPGRVTNAISLDKLLKSDRKDLWRLCDRTAEQARDRLEAREWCQAMLSQLDEKDRRLMLLRYADDMTFRQIGQVMGVSESTACLRHSMLLDRFRSVARQLYCTRRGAPARWKIGR